ncbi:hypothetical protein CLF_100300 [Clonorchis sinensis]|uniref:Uncharacterized protein n=1 Tax=Clonorchis sinensis TaxID=79923 RepID=G7Y352_CLOSI|nr:hypothetical protein CLF_100300 [Clonorchis sinensis]
MCVPFTLSDIQIQFLMFASVSASLSKRTEFATNLQQHLIEGDLFSKQTYLRHLGLYNAHLDAGIGVLRGFSSQDQKKDRIEECTVRFDRLMALVHELKLQSKTCRLLMYESYGLRNHHFRPINTRADGLKFDDLKCIVVGLDFVHQTNAAAPIPAICHVLARLTENQLTQAYQFTFLYFIHVAMPRDFRCRITQLLQFTPQITTQPTTQKSAYTQTTKPEISWQTSPKSTADTKRLHNTEIDQTVKSSGTTILSNPISSSNTTTREGVDRSTRNIHDKSESPNSTEINPTDSMVPTTKKSTSNRTQPPEHIPATWPSKNTSNTDNPETHEPMETSNPTNVHESQSSILADTETAGTTLPSTQMSSFIPTEASDHISPMNSSITHNASDQNKNPQTEENVDRSTGNIQHASESPISTEANTTPSSVASTQQSTSDSTEPANHSSATWVSWNTSKTGQIENTMTDENVEPSMGTTRQESQPPTPTNTHNERSAMSSAHQSFVVETATPLASLQTSSSMEVNETSPTVNTEIEERAENSKRTTLQGSQFPSSINSQTVSSTVSSTHHSFSIETTLPYVSSPSPSEINFYGTSSVAKAISDQTFESSMGRALDVSNYPRYTDNLTGRSTAISANYVFSVQSAATYNSSQTSPSMRTDVFSPSMNTSILRNSTRLRCTRSGGYSSVPFVVIYIVSLLVACLN